MLAGRPCLQFNTHPDAYHHKDFLTIPLLLHRELVGFLLLFLVKTLFKAEKGVAFGRNSYQILHAVVLRWCNQNTCPPMETNFALTLPNQRVWCILSSQGGSLEGQSEARQPSLPEDDSRKMVQRKTTHTHQTQHGYPRPEKVLQLHKLKMKFWSPQWDWDLERNLLVGVPHTLNSRPVMRVIPEVPPACVTKVPPCLRNIRLLCGDC